MATVPVDPEIEPLAAAIPIPDIDADALPAVRSAAILPPADLSGNVEQTDHVVDADTGVVVRVHRPVGFEGLLPCLYSIHGGGYIVGSYTADDAKFDRLCQELGIVGVSVEYRLAPETPFPGPVEDCYAGLRWTVEHAAEIGVDPDKIGITGVSAGGGLCAGLALLVRDRGELAVQFQLLECPMLDDRQQTPSSQLDGLMIWSKVSNAFGWQSYLGDLYGTDDVPAHAAPARSEDLSGLPEAYVCVGGADGFRDEDILYAMRLYDAGVPTELHVYPGLPHGVSMLSRTALARRYRADADDWLRRQFERLA